MSELMYYVQVCVGHCQPQCVIVLHVSSIIDQTRNHEGEGVLERQEKERNFVEGKYVRIVMTVSRPEADR